jgi:hypothetical protein
MSRRFTPGTRVRLTRDKAVEYVVLPESRSGKGSWYPSYRQFTFPAGDTGRISVARDGSLRVVMDRESPCDPLELTDAFEPLHAGDDEPGAAAA